MGEDAEIVALLNLLYQPKINRKDLLWPRQLNGSILIPWN